MKLQVDILLATPLRLELMLKEGKLQLDGVRHLILDEADKLFDLKFAVQVDAAIAACSHPALVRQRNHHNPDFNHPYCCVR